MLITESSSPYENIEQMEISNILRHINKEDKSVPDSIEKAIPMLEKLVEAVVERMKKGGRLFYIGAGTSGRLGIVDASECPPTFGVPHDWVIGIIAGGDTAIRKAVEFAEDDPQQAWKDLQTYQINALDTLVGIAASGRTPYVIGGVQKAREHHILTACIVCNPNSELAKNVDIPIEIIVGAEFITGSTRMKAGTAQKLVLNMLSTSVMIQLGRIRGNKMVDMQLSNHKLIERGIRFIMQELQVSAEEAETLLHTHGTVRKAIDAIQQNNGNNNNSIYE